MVVSSFGSYVDVLTDANACNVLEVEFRKYGQSCLDEDFWETSFTQHFH